MIALGTWDVLMLPLLVVGAIAARLLRRSDLIGLGPEPMINYVYDARALRSQGYRAETFVTNLFFITNRFDRILARKGLVGLGLDLATKRAYWHVVFHYRVLFTSFHGGPLGSSPWLWRLEPTLLRIAGIKTVIMPYGSDVQDLRRCKNLAYVNAISKDYPGHFRKSSAIARRISMWERDGTVVLSGCDWVDYMTYWDVLQVSHICIDARSIVPAVLPGVDDPSRPLRVLHAPNHRAIKGTAAIIEAVDALREEGVGIELVLLEGVPNDQVHQVIRSCDVIADQLVIGWYAMFAMEGMAHGRAVICHQDPRYLALFRNQGLLAEAEPPLIDATERSIKSVLAELCANRSLVAEHAQACRDYVLRHHSVEYMGEQFASILSNAGVAASTGSEVK